MDVTGPGSPFTVLFDDRSADHGHVGLPLAPELAGVFGPWDLPPAPEERPHVVVNFVVTRDGRISFVEPGHVGGGDISGFDGHDRWLMGLLRARADAVLMGAGTWREEPEHRWTPSFIEPGDAGAWRSLRSTEGRRAEPLQVFVSGSGRVPETAGVYDGEPLEIVVATSERGRAEVERRLRGRAEVLVLGDERVDLRALLRVLRRDRAVASLLCEGGPHLYGSLLACGAVDEEWLTLSPVVSGNPATGVARPGLVEGVAWPATAHPWSRPVALRRAGDHLFLRSRMELPPA